jgi:hypothetical protein
MRSKLFTLQNSGTGGGSGGGGSSAKRSGTRGSSSREADARTPSPVAEGSGRSTGRSRSRSRGRQEEGQHGSTSNDESDVEGAGTASEPAPAATAENKRLAREKNRKAREAKSRKAFNSLPPEQQEYIWNILVSRVGEVVEIHPLSVSVASYLKQEAVLEVSLQVRDLLASILVLPASTPASTGGNISLDFLFATVTRALSSTAGKRT